MKALFGEGLHPNADRITRRLTGFGVAQSGAIHAARLGRPFKTSHQDNAFTRRLRAAYTRHNLTIGHDAHASIEPEIRARIRTAVARDDVRRALRPRRPLDDRELSGFIAAALAPAPPPSPDTT